MDSKEFLFVRSFVRSLVRTFVHNYRTYLKSSDQSPLSFKFKSQLFHAAFIPWSCKMRDTNKNDSQASTLTSLVNSLSVVFAFTTFLFCWVEGTATCKYLYGMLPVHVINGPSYSSQKLQPWSWLPIVEAPGSFSHPTST